MRKIIHTIIISCLALLPVGCSTMQSIGVGDFSPYAGTHLDFWIMERYQGDRIPALLDAPFSFAADTALLPITLLYSNFETGDY